MRPPAHALPALWLLCCVLGSCSAVETEAGPDELLARAREIHLGEGPKAALPEYERVLELYREKGDRLGEAVTLGYIGNCHKSAGDFDRALELLRTALATKRELGASVEEAKTLNHLGLVFWEMGDYEAAAERLELAFELANEGGDAETAGAALNNLSLVFDELGEYERSLEQYHRALETFRAIDFPGGESDTLGNIGGVHLLLGRYREALGFYERALEIDEREGYKPRMSADLVNLALAQVPLGELDGALASADRALRLAREAGLAQEEAYALRARGDALLHAGRTDEGLEAYRRAMERYEDLEARGEEVEALGEMGSLLLALGDIASAADHFQRGAALAREIEDAYGLTHLLLDLGTLELRRNQGEAAEAHFLEARARAAEAGQGDLAARSRLGLARTYRRQGRLAEALAEAEAALADARAVGGVLLEARGLGEMGESELERKAAAAAVAHFDAGLAIARPLGDPALLWRLHWGRGRALAALSRGDEGVEALAAAVEVIESVRGRLREHRFRSGYLEDKHQVYIDLVRLLLELDRVEEALGVAERLRARSFLALLDRGPPPVRSAGERRREIELRERVRQLQRVLGEETGGTAEWRRTAAVELFSRELAQAEREYQAFLDDRLTPGYGAVRALEIPDPGAARRRLAPGAAVVEYVVADDALVVFVVTAESVRVTTVPLKAGELSTRVELLRDLLRRAEGELWRGPAAALGGLLIAPVERRGWLAGVDRLLLVPHGILHYLPFAALLRNVDGEPRTLTEDYVLSRLPALSALAIDGAAAANGSLLALAPRRGRLRWAPEEVESIARIHPSGSRTLLGREATEGAFKRLAPDYGLLHLASHGRFNKANPLLSGLELEGGGGDDGRLEVHEILRLPLRAELVTLSACDTGLAGGHFADIPAADDFVGLTRAFLLAGSGAVLATLWQVNDRSTLELMRSFYGHLGDDGGDRARALARAQREMRATDGRFRHPYYWAPFVLMEGS